jgi:hypothetical protein
MRDGFDINDDIRSLIDVDEVKNAIDGQIWIIHRHNNSKKTDIVIRMLAGNNEQIQQAVVNVRIHTPDLRLTLDGKVSSIPDHRTFNKLSNLLIPLLDERYMPSFWTEVVKPAYLFKDKDGSHFTLIQVNYYSIQDNYKNI